MQFEEVSEFRPLKFEAMSAQSHSSVQLPEIISPTKTLTYRKVDHIRVERNNQDKLTTT